MTNTILISLAGLAVGAIVLGFLVVRYGKNKRHQSRLDDAFDRAQQVQRSGSGLQGKPYSLYGSASWSSDTQQER